MGAVVAFKALEVIKSVRIALDAYKAAQIAAGAATAGTATATHILGLALKSIGIGLIIAAIAAAVQGISYLSGKVGGLGNAFKVVGQTIMKWILTPINLFFEYIKGVLSLLSNIPGIGDKIAGARDVVAGVQNKMNTLLTGSESTLFNSGLGALADPYKNARSAELARQEAAAEAAEIERRYAEAQEKDRAILEQIARNTGATTEAVEGLGNNGAPGVPGRLNYGQMGQEDFWSLARAGI
jgi:hypothetical protein